MQSQKSKVKWLELPRLWLSNLANRQVAWPRVSASLVSRRVKALPGDGEKLKDTQEQLNEEIEELLENIDQTARAMGGFNENATEDLLKEARESREGGIERSGKRAENSLLYEAFPQAKKEEEKVAENLEELEKGLEQVENKLRNLGNSALQELAERLQKTWNSCLDWERKN